MRRPATLSRRSLLCAVAFALAPAAASADAPLHQRIDDAVRKETPNFAKVAAAVADDAEFLRRVYLDLTGTVPTSDEARAFLKDAAPDRRAKLIDRLLAGPANARHLQEVFDVLLMDRRPGKHVPLPQWQQFLRDSFKANRPYDEFVREMLAADGSDPKTRPAARFYLDREGEPHVITRDLGRLFLGVNFQCAQCHDHPLVKHYRQDHYYGIYAFVNRSYVFNDKAKKLTVYAEKAEGEATYQSVFDPKLSKTTLPRLPERPPVTEPKSEKGKEYLVPPGKVERPVPRYSRRAQLPALLASADNPQFARTTANRLWALMLGRGIIEPVDLDHPANPPSHPELLKLLADELAATKFDLRAFLREIALSETYQRSSLTPKDLKEVPENGFTVGRVRALSPEQLAWAAMQATGVTDAERKAAPKLTDEALYAKLSGNLAQFVKVFGGAPGQTDDHGFQATIDQSLFLKNGALLRTWLAPRPGNLTDRLSGLKDSAAVAEELYLGILTRLPSAEERQEIAEYLGKRTADRPAALQELAWALLTSAEFRFNH